MKRAFSRQIFEKHSNIQSHENPSSGSPVCSMRTDRQKDMINLVVAFYNCENAPKNCVHKLIGDRIQGVSASIHSRISVSLLSKDIRFKIQFTVILLVALWV